MAPSEPLQSGRAAERGRPVKSTEAGPTNDTVAVVAGTVFLVLGIGFLAHFVAGFTLEIRWLWPVLLILAGLAVLFTTRPSRR